jgi:hypothetical protein
VVVLSWGAAAASASPASLLVIPHPASGGQLSYFKVPAEAGASTQAGSIELRNPTGRTLRVSLAAVDGNTLGTLGSGYAPPGSRPHGSTLWLALTGHDVVLGPRTSVSVPISVRVPGGSLPGDYLSGVSVEAQGQQAQGLAHKGVSIASVERYVIGVEVSLAGPRTPLIQFTGAKLERDPAGLTFLLRARNSGNVILQGVYGHVRITRDGRTVISRTIPAGTFVTHTAIAYPVSAFDQTPTEGARYRVQAWLSYPSGVARLDTTVSFGHRQAVLQQQYSRKQPASGGGTAWWKLVAALAVCLYALFTTTLLLRRRGRGERKAIPL